jgi:sugar phosphate isomerase/epimerase
MRIGVSSYSFTAAVKAGRMEFIEIPAKAKEMGFDVIEFAALIVPEGETTSDFAARLKDACDKSGIQVGNYTIKADFINGVNVPPEEEPERLRDELEIAKILGSPGMRHDATWRFSGTFDQALPILAEGCRKVTEIAAAMGIKTMVENHGFFAQDSDRMEKLVAAVGHENFGLLVDMGNFLCADEDPTHAVGRVAPFASHVHAKDFHVKPGYGPDPGQGWFRSRAGNYLRGAIIGHGVVPVGQCLDILKRVGYDGVVSIEFEGIEAPEVGIPYGLENLKKYLGAAGA